MFAQDARPRNADPGDTRAPIPAVGWCNGRLDRATVLSRFTFKVPSRLPGSAVFSGLTELVFEARRFGPPIADDAPPAPSNGCSPCRLLAANRAAPWRSPAHPTRPPPLRPEIGLRRKRQPSRPLSNDLPFRLRTPRSRSRVTRPRGAAGASPRRRGISPPPSGRLWRSAAATAGSAATSTAGL
jgi:hypothetical protein